MIIRVLRGRVPPSQVAVFRQQALEVLNAARGSDGIVHVEVGRQVHSDGAEEVVFVSVWRSLEALYRWVGTADLLETPVLSSGRSNIFEQFEVQHYETYESGEPDGFGGLDPAAAAVADSHG